VRQITERKIATPYRAGVSVDTDTKSSFTKGGVAMRNHEAIRKLVYTLGAAALTFFALTAFYGKFIADIVHSA